MGDLKNYLANQKQLADYITSMNDDEFTKLKASILGATAAITKYRERLEEFR